MAAATAATPLMGTGTLKAPATTSNTVSGLGTTFPAQRRAARPVSSDFLSDKATTALVRRTLCAQHLADRGRSTPAPIEDLLPPLTSRNDVDLQLYALISIIIREYVQKWYTNITPDSTFVAEIVQIIAHCTRALEQRLRKVDMESLLLDEIPELLDAHVRAYRTAQNSAARPPIEAKPREIYHSLCPLPALSPVPRSEDAKSIQTQAENEAAYRQLLVQGVLALLLPTEDLENECLTSLVGQIFSELIIGNLVTNKLSEPWLIWEVLIIITRVAGKTKSQGSSGTSGQDTAAESRGRNWSIHHIFWSVIQWTFLAVTSIRLIISTIVLSRSLPPRSGPISAQKPDSTSHYDDEKSYNPLSSPPVKAPIMDFNTWPCIANLLEMDVRMPWLGGALSMMQWAAMRGPGRVADYDGIIDRLLSHLINARLLDPGMIPSLLRSIRAAVFPNNAPGPPGLVPPSSDEELAALRRRCASAIWALVPKGVASIYFGSPSLWPPPRSGPLNNDIDTAAATSITKESCDNNNDDEEDGEDGRMVSDIATGILDVFSDSYCNKHLMYGVLELILVRLMPELAEKGIIELWEERLSAC